MKHGKLPDWWPLTVSLGTRQPTNSTLP